MVVTPLLVAGQDLAGTAVVTIQNHSESAIKSAGTISFRYGSRLALLTSGLGTTIVPLLPDRATLVFAIELPAWSPRSRVH